MNTENETGVKVPKGQINYNTIAGSLGLAAFAGLGLRNLLMNELLIMQIAISLNTSKRSMLLRFV
jgi:hypothetical protein